MNLTDNDKVKIQMSEESSHTLLAQQELMLALAEKFFTVDDITELMDDALRMVGEFMSVTRIVVSRPEANSEISYAAFFWCGDKMIKTAPAVAGLNELIFSSFPREAQPGSVPTVYCCDTRAEQRYSILEIVNVKAFIWAPLYVNGEYWGMLSVEDCKDARVWTEGERQMIGLISKLISAAARRVLVEQQLTRMSSIVRNSPHFIAYINSAGELEYANEGASDMTGYKNKELLKGGMGLLLDNDVFSRLENEYRDIIATEDRREYMMDIHVKGGAIRVVQVSIFTISGKSAGLGVIGLDITDNIRMERERAEALAQAESSNRAKSEFLSRMSHEMRTPMNAIIGMTNIGRNSAEIERKDYCFDKIDDASKHLLGVINDVLDMSKIEAGKLEISNTEFNLEKMLRRVSDVVGFRVDEKNIEFSVRIEEGVPVSVISDDQRLAQVLTNFLSNAVKFTPEKGAVSLTVRLVSEDTDGNCRLEFTVTDTGIGISKENQAKLFNSFEQADGGISRKYGGTGLGLAISKRIVDMMSGEIRIESEEGRGSSFIFDITAKRGTQTARRLIMPGDMKKDFRILAVDDSRDVLEYFKNLTNRLGIYCDLAESGREACRLMEKGGNGYYAMIFVDWRMPGMNGVELTRCIKERLGHKPVVIMISATEWSDIEEMAKAAGVDGFIPKPLFPSSVVDCISEYAGVEKYTDDAPASGEGESEETVFEGCCILIAEDIEINREIVIALLSDTGIVIDTVDNGAKAVAAFADNPERYDLIFMDIHMPEMDGFQAAREIRALNVPRAADIPIVAMTANVFREDIERCLDAGMNAHIGKPIDINDILDKLHTYLDR
jgi:PAS domain S-box-containing protein